MCVSVCVRCAVHSTFTKLQDLKHFTLATRKSQQKERERGREIYLSFVVQKVSAFKVFQCFAMLFYKTDLLQNYPLVTLLSQNELDEQKIALAICVVYICTCMNVAFNKHVFVEGHGVREPVFYRRVHRTFIHRCSFHLA